MKANNNAWNVSTIKCITNGWLIGICLVNDDNSARYGIIHNKCKRQDDVLPI